MANETNPTVIQSADQPSGGQFNPFDLVNQKWEVNHVLQANEHKSFVDKIVWWIAKLMWKPDPFTWASDVNLDIYQNPAKQNEITNDEWGLFTKFAQKVGDVAKTVVNDPSGSAKIAVDTLGNIGQTVGKNTLETVNAITTDPAGSVKNIENTVNTVANSLWTKAIDVAETIAAVPLVVAKNTVETVGNVAIKAGETTFNALQSMANNPIESMKMAAQTVVDTTTTVGEKVFDVTKNMVNDPLGSAKNLGDTVLKVGDTIVWKTVDIITESEKMSKDIVHGTENLVSNLGTKIEDDIEWFVDIQNQIPPRAA
jgi:hypothetical protein